MAPSEGCLASVGTSEPDVALSDQTLCRRCHPAAAAPRARLSAMGARPLALRAALGIEALKQPEDTTRSMRLCVA